MCSNRLIIEQSTIPPLNNSENDSSPPNFVSARLNTLTNISIFINWMQIGMLRRIENIDRCFHIFLGIWMYWAIDCIHRATTKYIHLTAAANQWNLESTKMIQSILCYALVASEYNKLSRKYHKMIEMQVESKLFGVCGSDMFVSILYLILIFIHT